MCSNESFRTFTAATSAGGLDDGAGRWPRKGRRPSTSLEQSHGRHERIRKALGIPPNSAGRSDESRRGGGPRGRGIHRRSPPCSGARSSSRTAERIRDRKSTRLNSSHANISYAVFCLKK